MMQLARHALATVLMATAASAALAQVLETLHSAQHLAPRGSTFPAVATETAAPLATYATACRYPAITMKAALHMMLDDACRAP